MPFLYYFSYIKNKSGYTALMLAAGRGHKEVVQALIAAGAKVNIQNRPSETALIFAVQRAPNDNIEIVQALLNARVDTADKSDLNRALMIAATNGRLDIVQALITKGVEVDFQDGTTGYTALMIAAQYDRTGVVQALIAAGADVNIKNSKTGETAFDYATDPATKKTFEENKKLREAMVSGNVEAFKGSDYDKICEVRVPILSGRWDKFKWALVEYGLISENFARFKSQSFHEQLLGNEDLLRKYIEGTSSGNKAALYAKCTQTQLTTLHEVQGSVGHDAGIELAAIRAKRSAPVESLTASPTAGPVQVATPPTEAAQGTSSPAGSAQKDSPTAGPVQGASSPAGPAQGASPTTSSSVRPTSPAAILSSRQQQHIERR